MRGAVAGALRQFILANELAHTRSGLRQLIGWLQTIAEDFAAHGVDVSDLRETIRNFERELQRRHRHGQGGNPWKR